MRCLKLLSLFVSAQFFVGSAALGQEIEVVRRVACDPWSNSDGTLREMREAEPDMCSTSQLGGIEDTVFGVKFPSHYPARFVTTAPKYRVPLDRQKLVDFFALYCVQENALGGNFDIWDRPRPDDTGFSPPCAQENMPRVRIHRTINLQDPSEPLILYPPTGMEVPRSQLKIEASKMLNALIALIRKESLTAQEEREEAAAAKRLHDLGLDHLMGKKK